MSEIQVNKISPSSGTSITLGDSGDTFTIPSGATFTNNGTATGFGENNTPYFSVKGSGTQTASNGANTNIQFNTLVDSLDSASGYNTGTYEYTVQSEGAGLWYLRAGF